MPIQKSKVRGIFSENVYARHEEVKNIANEHLDDITF